MVRIEKMIIIGATARHSGKTELAYHVIHKFSSKVRIIGIKISAIHGGDSSFHGSMEKLNENFTIEKNSKTGMNKSTDRMSAAGAAETFWVHTKSEFLDEALQKLLPMLDKNSFLVCESNSIRKIVLPDLFFLITNLNKEIKNTALEVRDMADYAVEFDGERFTNFDLSRVEIENNKWVLK
jgi:hypothetical protein